MKHIRFCFCACIFMLLSASTLYGQYPRFKVLAFYSNTVEKAHIDFADDAIQFFKELTVGNGFVFDTTSNMEDLNDAKIRDYQLLMMINDFRTTRRNGMLLKNIWKTEEAGLGSM